MLTFSMYWLTFLDIDWMDSSIRSLRESVISDSGTYIST